MMIIMRRYFELENIYWLDVMVTNIKTKKDDQYGTNNYFSDDEMAGFAK